VALAVFGGFGTMFVEFLEETRAVEPGDDETGDDETGDEKTGAEA
jgi:hypothetical protein